MLVLQVVLLAMSTVASIIVPSEVAKAKKEAQLSTKAVDLREARFAADRYIHNTERYDGSRC